MHLHIGAPHAQALVHSYTLAYTLAHTHTLAYTLAHTHTLAHTGTAQGQQLHKVRVEQMELAREWGTARGGCAVSLVQWLDG